jgi:hypothetical protein
MRDFPIVFYKFPCFSDIVALNQVEICLAMEIKKYYIIECRKQHKEVQTCRLIKIC